MFDNTIGPLAIASALAQFVHEYAEHRKARLVRARAIGMPFIDVFR